jgi:hypothetical protein
MSLVKIKAWGNPPRVNDSTRFGTVTARFSATMAPSEYPQTWARFTPTASRTAMTSDARFDTP